jgi:hypothetical protein
MFYFTVPECKAIKICDDHLPLMYHVALSTEDISCCLGVMEHPYLPGIKVSGLDNMDEV